MTRKHWLLVGIFGAAALLLLVLWLADTPDSESEDPAVRRQAAAELKGKTDEGSLRTLHRLSQDTDTTVARAAVRAIREGKHERNQAMLSRILTEAKNGKVRGDAAAALGEFENVPVGTLVNVLENDSDPSARAGAARGLGRRGDPNAVKQLLRALYDRDPDVRLWAITAISRITALRFDYNAKLLPDQQEDKMAKVRHALRTRCGL